MLLVLVMVYQNNTTLYGVQALSQFCPSVEEVNNEMAASKPAKMFTIVLGKLLFIAFVTYLLVQILAN